MKNLVRVLLVGLESLLVLSGAYASPAESENNPPALYEIRDAYDMDTIIRAHPDWDYVLGNDIDASVIHNNGGWNPIPEFRGRLDGGGYRIHGLRINLGTSPAGFILRTTGEIRNLGIEADTVSGVGVVGILASTNEGLIENCYVSGYVSGTTSVGGLVGANGGVIGVIRGSYSLSSVSGESGVNCRVGGLVGRNMSKISDSYAAGSVTVSGSGTGDVGGLLGSNSSGDVTRVYSRASVSVSSSTAKVGGLIGALHNGEVVSSYYDKSLSGIATGYGDGKTSGVSADDSYDGLLSAEDTWTLAHAAYPYLSTQGSPVSIEYAVMGGTVLSVSDLSSIEVYRNGIYDTTLLDVVGETSPLLLPGVTSGDEVSFISRVADKLLPSYSVHKKVALFRGAGTSDDPYLIHNAWQLDSVRHCLSDTFSLKSDIDLTEYLEGSTVGWDPISTFTGVFHGNNHVIRGLRIDRAQTNYVGLFGKTINEGTLIDSLGVEIDPAGFVRGGISVGGLVGLNDTKASIVGCYVSGAVIGSQNVGGLVGGNDGSISGSYSLGSVTGSNTVGGLSGVNYGYDGKISGSYSGSVVTGRTFLDIDVQGAGGFVGDNNGEIFDSYSSGSVSGNEGVGGFIGTLTGGKVKRNYTISKVSGVENVGGFAGYSAMESLPVVEISSNYYDSLLSGDLPGFGSYYGDEPAQGSTPQSESNVYNISVDRYDLSSYTDFSSDTWSIIEGLSYPYFSWQSDPVSITDTRVGQLGLSWSDEVDSLFITGDGVSHSYVIGSGVTDEFPLEIGVDSSLAIVSYDASKRCPSYPVRGVVSAFAVEVGDTVVITNAAQLDAIRHYIGTADVVYELSSDIDMSSYLSNRVDGWSPLGSATTPFHGTFNGRGHRIYNLWSSHPDLSHVGLFGYVESSSIDSVGIELSSAGIIGGDYVGGLAGSIVSTPVSHSYVIGSVGGVSHVGGLVGVSNSSISLSFSSGSVSGDLVLGGLVGSLLEGSISDSYSTSSVSGVDTVGGFIGYNDASVLRSYSSGAVESSKSGADHVGGFVGLSGDATTISSSYYAGTSSSPAAGGVTVLGINDRYNLSKYDGFSSAVWSNVSGKSYPYFTNQSAPIEIVDTLGTYVRIRISEVGSVSLYQNGKYYKDVSYTSIVGEKSPLFEDTFISSSDTITFISRVPGKLASYPSSGALRDLDIDIVGPDLTATCTYKSLESPVLNVHGSAAGSSGVSYQWYEIKLAGASDLSESSLDTVAIAGATNSSLPVSTSLPVGEYQYICKVIAGGTPAWSKASTVSITPASPDPSHLEYNLYAGLDSVFYTNAIQHAYVSLNSSADADGVGPITVTYRSEGSNELVDPLNAGEYIVHVSFAAGSNYAAAEIDLPGSYVIHRAHPSLANITSSTLPASPVTYTGEPVTVAVATDIISTPEVLYGYGYAVVEGVVEGVDESVDVESVAIVDSTSVLAPVNAGHYLVSVSLSGTSNYLPATLDLGELVISRASLPTDVFSLSVDTIVYGTLESDYPVLTGELAGAGVSEGLRYAVLSDADQVLSESAPVSVGEYSVYALFSDAGANYEGGTLVIDTLVITKATPSLDLLLHAAELRAGGRDVYGEEKLVFSLDTILGVKGIGDITLLFDSVYLSEYPTLAGEYTLGIAFSEGSNYIADTLWSVSSYVIERRELRDYDFIIAYVDSVYNGSELGVRLSKSPQGIEYELSYHLGGDSVSPVEVGVYEVRITATGNANYVDTTGLVIGAYEIHRALISLDMLVSGGLSPASYDGLPHGIQIGSNALISRDSVTLRYVDAVGNVSDSAVVSAGVYTVLADVVGVPNYRDTFGLELGTFEIVRAPLVSGIFSTSADTLVYTGSGQSVKVDTADWAVGVGEIVEVLYSPLGVTPSTASANLPLVSGSYGVYVHVEGGVNYEGSELLLLDTLVITKATPRLSDLEYSGLLNIVGDHKTARQVDVEKTNVELGKLTVLYNGKESAPVLPGLYDVSVLIDSSANYLSDSLYIGSFEILKPTPNFGVVKELFVNKTGYPFYGSSLVYTGQAYSLKIDTLSSAVDGIGAITSVLYNGDSTNLPVSVGRYGIAVEILEGKLYAGGTIFIDSIEVFPGRIEAHRIGIKAGAELPLNQFDIEFGAPGLVIRSLEVRYGDDGKLDVPYIPGKYRVTISVKSDGNYAELSRYHIGDYELSAPSDIWVAMPSSLPAGLSSVYPGIGSVNSVDRGSDFPFTIRVSSVGVVPVVSTGRVSDGSDVEILPTLDPLEYMVRVRSVESALTLSFSTAVNGIGTGVIGIESSVNRVWSRGSELVILSDLDDIARVYSISGQLLGSASVGGGIEVRMSLPRGYYIILLGNRSHKIRIN